MVAFRAAAVEGKAAERKPRGRPQLGPHEPPVSACPEIFLSFRAHFHNFTASLCACSSHSPFSPRFLALIMLQRSLFRASRQAVRPVKRIQPAFTPIRQPVGTRVAPAIRWYSDAPAAESKPTAEAKPAESTPAEAKPEPAKDEVAQLKEQLDKKDREIIDLKVRHAPHPPRHAC